jgi:putative ABC transport system substrate-binding protein
LIAALGGLPAVWPLAVRAQHPGKLSTIGFLGTTDPSSMRPWITAFVERLRDLGWIEDRTIAIDCPRFLRLGVMSMLVA